jgi:hypothetical protein
MSPADLVTLLEGIFDGWTVKQLRAPGGLNVELEDIEDDVFALLVRFVAGERPVTATPDPVVETRLLSTPNGQPLAFLDDDDPPPPREDIEIGGETGVRLLG